MEQKLRFALFGNEYQTKKSASAALLLGCLRQYEAEVFVERTFYDFLRQMHGGEPVVAALCDSMHVFDVLDFPVDYAISMGGDGTLLKTASHVGATGVPIIGVNTGRLGFLADFLPNEIEQALDELYAGKCRVEEHAAIKLSLRDGSSGSNGSMSLRDGSSGLNGSMSLRDEHEFKVQSSKSLRDGSKGSNGSKSLRDGSKGSNGSIGYPYALNDIAVLKRDNASMITIHARINGDELVTYQADGLVVSTPTGSTAYNLSNGGPIMAPLTGILCLTPVAPHSLNIRPIVINDDSVIELTVESRTHNYLVAVDGRSATLDESIPLVISKAPYTVRIVKRASQHYFATLREKMMWGMDAR
ncbi:MAG: NAD(+)/NADH kinase [Prevotella sp.]|nr:NAD(+)/NADH kinase [Prevotella sp.]